MTEDEKKICEWESEDDDGTFSSDWQTGCNNIFEFSEGNPKDNNFKFCPFCGKEIVIISSIIDEEEE